jgi:hypothetical protein
MKKRVLIILFSLVFLLAGSNLIQAAGEKGFSLYIGGAFNLVNPADINDMRNDIMDSYDGTGDYFNWDEFKSMLEANLEFVYHLSSYFGVGLGFGYMMGGVDDISYGWESGSNYADYTRTFDVSAFFVNLNIHGFYPISPRLTISAMAGIDYYFGTYKSTLDGDYDYYLVTYIPPWYIWWHFFDNYTRDEEATQSTIGFHGGVNFDIGLSPNIYFVIGVLYRYVNFNDLQGTLDYQSTIWTDESYEGTLAFDTEDPYLMIEEEGDISGDLRKAEINLSGLSFSAGFRIMFGGKK